MKRYEVEDEANDMYESPEGCWIDHDDHLDALKEDRKKVLAEVRKAWDAACAQYDGDATLVFDKSLVALEAKK